MRNSINYIKLIENPFLLEEIQSHPHDLVQNQKNDSSLAVHTERPLNILGCDFQLTEVWSTDSIGIIISEATPSDVCIMNTDYQVPDESNEQLTRFSMLASEESLREGWENEDDEHWESFLR